MKKPKIKDGKYMDKLQSYFTRCTNETPPFFKKLRTAGLVIAAAGTTLLAAPVALPASVIALGGYLLVGGTVATAMSQAAIAEDGKKRVINQTTPRWTINRVIHPKRLAEAMKPGVCKTQVMKVETCANSNLNVHIKTKRKPRFKAGAELSSSVNLVAVEVNEEVVEDTEVFELKIKLDMTRCVADTCELN